eukprot:Rmarinus@m.14566
MSSAVGARRLGCARVVMRKDLSLIASATTGAGRTALATFGITKLVTPTHPPASPASTPSTTTPTPTLATPSPHGAKRSATAASASKMARALRGMPPVRLRRLATSRSSGCLRMATARCLSSLRLCPASRALPDSKMSLSAFPSNTLLLSPPLRPSSFTTL